MSNKPFHTQKRDAFARCTAAALCVMNRKVAILGILSSIFGGAFGAEVLPVTIVHEEGFFILICLLRN